MTNLLRRAICDISSCDEDEIGCTERHVRDFVLSARFVFKCHGESKFDRFKDNRITLL